MTQQYSWVDELITCLAAVSKQLKEEKGLCWLTVGRATVHHVGDGMAAGVALSVAPGS